MKKLNEYPTARSGEQPGCWLMSVESEELYGPELTLHHLIPAPVCDAADAVMQAAPDCIHCDTCQQEPHGCNDCRYMPMRDALAKYQEVAKYEKAT